jgi:hypothetical protein
MVSSFWIVTDDEARDLFAAKKEGRDKAPPEEGCHAGGWLEAQGQAQGFQEQAQAKPGQGEQQLVALMCVLVIAPLNARGFEHPFLTSYSVLYTWRQELKFRGL